jgi:hypothetical protein
VNTHRTRSVETRLAVAGLSIRSGNVFEIACDPELEVWSDVAEAIAPRQKALPVTNLWSFPPASVSAVELDVVAAKE